MKLGLIARCDQSGLANQTFNYFQALNPDKVLLINVGHLADEGKHCNKRSFPERFPGAIEVKSWMPDNKTVEDFLDGLDTVLSAETFYTPIFARLARKAGVRTALACNPEFLNVRDQPDLWLPPTTWMWNSIPKNKHHLPVPITPGPPRRPEITPHFLHIVGRPAVHHRNGTLDLVQALKHVTENITVTVRCQEPGYVSGLIGEHRIHTPPNVVLRVESGDVENNRDLYTEGDILVMPRRFGGLCLPAQEAIAAGMPVLMPAISPNEWLPSEWLFPAVEAGSFMAKQRVTFYRTDPEVLAAKLDQYARLQPSTWQADIQRLQHQLSWTRWKPIYEEVLSSA